MRIIAHFDADAFFAAVEERDNERFKNKPIVVGADPRAGKGRGVVSTANYKAREYGIHSAQPISTAWRLSEAAKRKGKPAAIFIGVNMEKYRDVSEKVMAILQKYIPVVEQTSVDEAYGDLSFTGSYPKAEAVSKEIKKEIRKKEKLTVSVGIAPNRFIAKIASGLQKPDGLTVVGADDEKTRAELTKVFLEPLSVRQIPGVGPKTEALLKERKIESIKDLKKLTRRELQAMFGKWGVDLYEKARGRDETPVETEYIRKSIGEEETFFEDTRDPNFISERLLDLVKMTFERFAGSEFKAFRTVTVKVRFSNFETKTRSRTLDKPASTLKILQFEALRLALPFFDKRENPKRQAIRLIGVRIEKLVS